MIICCNNCNKKFEVNSDLIPAEGRLVQCSACNHEWFFKISISTNTIKANELDGLSIDKDILIQKKDEFIAQNKSENRETLIRNKLKKDKKKINILKLITLFIISFAAIIILIDTFKYPISKIIPNIEFILYNLYESIKDIILFFNDLI